VFQRPCGRSAASVAYARSGEPKKEGKSHPVRNDCHEKKKKGRGRPIPAVQLPGERLFPRVAQIVEDNFGESDVITATDRKKKGKNN